jgi:adenylate cyclase class 2
MYEIELKAHVYDYAAVKNTVDSFAVYYGFADKNDIYWHIPSVTVRVRTQKFTKANGTQNTTHIVTYKQKELRESNVAGESAIEVNDEKEFTISETEPFITLLKNLGFTLKITKHKAAHAWKHGRALIELCTVEPLGHFLEIEILSESNDEQYVAQARAEIESLLQKSGVALSNIEEQNYADLLKAAVK